MSFGFFYAFIENFRFFLSLPRKPKQKITNPKKSKKWQQHVLKCCLSIYEIYHKIMSKTQIVHFNWSLYAHSRLHDG